MNLELIISCSSIVIALSASAATIWQGILMRKHNRLSVKPFLRIDNNAELGKKGEVRLINVGAGPAIIDSMAVYVDGKLIDNPDLKVKMLNALNLIDPTENGHYYTLYPGEVFAVGESHYLFEMSNISKTAKYCAEVERQFKRLSFVIKYKSIYNDNFSL